ncbi:MAG: glycoside hydrolase, family 35 [Bryobacterales bacterium]|nr:glycoside hydrolase, family 35 [Bryobacterales bacterium]
MRLLCALACLSASLVAQSPAGFTESAEYPWAGRPAHLWARDLIWLKSAGIRHVSLPPAKDGAELTALISIVRALNLEADLEGPVPKSLEGLLTTHGGPLTEALSGPPARVSALAPNALTHATALFLTPAVALIWTDLFDTLAGSVFHAGACSFTGTERPAALAFHRHAQLTRYWAAERSSGPGLRVVPGAKPLVATAAVAVRQYQDRSGASFVMAVNASRAPWSGDLQAGYSASKRFIALPSVTVPAQDSLRLPMNIPLMDGPLCRNCSGFATTDHLIYATAELTAMEYDNGILALEFYAPASGEALLQLHREPSGPLVAGGKLTEFTWDSSAKRLRLNIPPGPAPSHRIRIAIAIDAPDATAFFPNAKVLLIGEANRLTAQYSSEAIAERSRLVARPGLETSRDARSAATPLEAVFRITPPATMIDGDAAELAIEADGLRLSHAEPKLRKPATLSFADGVAVRLAGSATLPLYPTTIPVAQKGGREVTLVIHNNAQEIRTFHLDLKADGLDFSPASADVTVGYAAQRAVTFRVFASSSASGVHVGEARLSGAATATEPVRFVVLPQNAPVAWSADGFSFLESLRQRATFLPGRWLEFIGKDNGRDALPAGGQPFLPGTLHTSGEDLVVEGQTTKTFRLRDVEAMLPKPSR